MSLSMHAQQEQTAQRPKGPAPWPFFGNLFDIADRDGSMRAIDELLHQYNGMVAVTLQGQQNFICSDAEVLQDMLARPEDFAKLVDQGSLGLGNLRKKSMSSGLFTSSDTDELWQIAHRILLPGFGVEAIRQYYTRMVEVADELLAHFDAFPSAMPVLITDWMTRMTFEAIGYAGFSTRFHCMQQADPPPFVHAMQASLTDAMKATRRLFPSSFYFWANRKRQKADALQKETVMQIIRERTARMARGEVFPNDLLQLMLTGKDRVTHKQLPEDNIAAQLLTFLIAGHETTSGLLSYAIYHLIKRPDIEQQLLAEVDSVLGRDYTFRPAYDDLNKLSLTLRILKETLRLNPTAPGFAKTATRDTVVAGKYLIKKGETTRFYLPALHRDPKYWPQPETFDPERFLPEAENKRHPGAYHPFGGGMRACIGFQFALKEATMVLARLYQRYRFHFYDKNYQLHHMRTLTTKPKDLKVLIEKRLEEKGKLPAQDQKISAAPLSPASNVAENAPPLLFLYGSNMGHCQEIAHKFALHAQAKGFNPVIKELDAQVENAWPAKQVIIISSTYNGSPPDNALNFEKWLKNLTGKPFADIDFTVLGLGNKQWQATFQRFPHYLDARLQELGAHQFYKMGIADVDGDFDQAIEAWAKGAWQELQRLQPTITTNLAETEIPHLTYSYEVTNFAGALSQKMPLLPLDQQIMQMPVKEIRELLAPEAGRSTKHMQIELPKAISYQAGDHVGILPENPMEIVEKAAKLCNLRLEDTVVIKSLQPSVEKFPVGQPIAVQDVLTSFLDLQGPVSRKEIRLLAQYCRCPHQQKQLQSLAEAQFAEDVLGKELSILDICQQFSAIASSLDLLLSARPTLKPRYYSISSSPQILKDSIEITVGVQEHKTKASALFKGLCSHYLARSQPESLVKCFIKDTKSYFRLPEDPKQDLILIGPGTGVAPLRGFLQERYSQRAQNIPIGRQVLFFGCRRADQDFLYQQELEGYLHSGLLQGLFVAFSRMPAQPKVYVQDLLRAQASLVWEYVQNNARILVCGDGKCMAPAVREALVDIFAQEGKLSKESAQELFNDKRSTHHYVEDVWAGLT